MAEVYGPTLATSKINKLRWKPECVLESYLYVTGSWDNEENDISLWSHPVSDDPYQEPDLLQSYTRKGDVTEMAFINYNTFVASSSEGSLEMFQIDVDKYEPAKFRKITEWKNIHSLPLGDSSSCTSLANFENDIVTVGEDSKINFLKAPRATPLHTIDDAVGCSLNCVCFVTHNSVATGNSRGDVNIWNAMGSDKPVSSLYVAQARVPISCMAFHPSQRHILLVGTQDGRIIVWDLRNTKFHMTMLDAHAGAVNELKFHPDRPDHLLSCSSDGALWHWNTTPRNREPILPMCFRTGYVAPPEINVWLQGDRSVKNMAVGSVLWPLHMSVNTVDIEHSRAACGCDTQALYIISDIFD